MTIDDLKNVRRQRLRVMSLSERIERLRSRAEFTSRELGEHGHDDATRDKLAEYVATLDELERQLTGEMIVLERGVMAIDQELTALPENQEVVLRLRYCEGLSWKRVSRGAGYCLDYCKQLDGKFRKTTHTNSP